MNKPDTSREAVERMLQNLFILLEEDKKVFRALLDERDNARRDISEAAAIIEKTAELPTHDEFERGYKCGLQNALSTIRAKMQEG